MNSRLVTGEGAAASLVSSAGEQLAEVLGFRPYPGTLNLEGTDIERFPATVHDEELADVTTDDCRGMEVRPCRVAGVLAAILRPLVPDYPEGKTEVLAPVHLRSLFGFNPGDAVSLHPHDRVWPPPDQPAEQSALNLFDAVIFDLDGTLVDLDVDWMQALKDIELAIGDRLDRELLRAAGTSASRAPDLFAEARKQGVYEDLLAILRDHELEGIETSRPLDAVGVLGKLSCPVGICTANAVETARRALSGFDALQLVNVIVGRESVHGHKPEPGPLLACVEELGVMPGNSLFIGDMKTDAQTALRAQTSFLAVSQLSSD